MLWNFLPGASCQGVSKCLKTAINKQTAKTAKKKDDQTNLNKEVKRKACISVFKCFFLVRYDLRSNVMFCLVWFVQKIQGRG